VSESLIGVISDTHGLFDPKLPSLFSSVSRILHAGDVGHLRVLEQLAKIAPVTAISGNIDEGNLPPGFATEEEICLEGIQIFMTHILGSPARIVPAMRKRIEQAAPNVVIFGHSHKPLLETIEGILYFNPGSAGPRRFSLPRSVGLLRIREGKCEGEIVYL